MNRPGPEVERLLTRICTMDRRTLTRELLRVRGRDFTEDFLGGMSVERLRHVLLAVRLHTRDKARACPA